MIKKHACLVLFGAVVAANGLTVSAFGAAPPTAIGARAALSKAIRAIERQEDFLRVISLRSDFSNYYYRRSDGARITGGCKCRAVLEGVPRGKLRFDASWFKIGSLKHPQIEAYSTAFNGTFCTHLLAAINHGGTKWYPLNRGSVSERLRNSRTLYAYLGWQLSVFGFTTRFTRLPPSYPHLADQRFSDYLQPDKAVKWAKTTVKANWVRLGARRLLRVARVGPPLGEDEFYLDPTRGYSIRYYRQFGWKVTKMPDGKLKFGTGGPLLSTFRVLHFYRLHAGVYYPKEVRIASYDVPHGGGAPKCAGRAFARISHLRVNAQVLIPPHEFTIDFPRGAKVMDTRTGKTVIVAGTPAEQWRVIRQTLEKTRASIGSP